LPVAEHEPAPEFTWREGIPVLAGALSWFATRVVERHEIGDHTLFVGAVLDFGTSGSVTVLLAYHRSGFAQLTPGSGGAVPIDAWDGGILDLWG
jgi:flavin reductase (DIM6/NTAB) family NADH-FMN oxidoreductase RutF